MFVITATVGNSFKNDRSLSSASATISSPLPRRALLPNALSRPPITAVGSRPARSSTSAIIDVVVVLPCAPATAIANRRRISSASISARGMTGMFRRTASTTSGFLALTAEVTTTTSAPPTCSAACPMATRTPSPASRSVTCDRRWSDPVTTYPRLASSSAMPLIPMPPTPMKWTRRVFPSTGLSRRVHKDPASVADQRQRAIDDHLRGVGPRQRARRRGHPLPRRAVAHQPVNPLRQHGAGRI